jgi:hypothetical protein
LTSSEDKTLCTWDIFTEKLVSKYKLDKEIVSMTVNKNLTYLAVVFKGDKHISLWHINRLSLFSVKTIKIKFASHLNFVGEDKRLHYFKAKAEEDEEDEVLQDIDEQLYNDIEELLEQNQEVQGSSSSRGKQVSFTDVPQNKWLPLNYIEQIEDRNKPEKKQNVEVPFFLDFDNPLNRIKQAVLFV